MHPITNDEANPKIYIPNVKDGKFSPPLKRDNDSNSTPPNTVGMASKKEKRTPS